MSLDTPDLGMTVQARRWTIGRAPECDYVVSHALVSSRHAVLEERPNGRWYITDNGSSNGTYLNGPEHRIERATPVTSDDVVYFSRQFSVTAGEILRALGAKAKDGQPLKGQIVQVSRPVISIGRDRKNDVVLDNPFVSRSHARIERLGDQVILRDLGSSHGTVINQELIRGGTRAITAEDKIEIGGMTLSLQFSATDDVTRVGVQREGIYIVSQGVQCEVKAEHGMKRLLQDIDLTVFPGEFVGLMGPSGSGKTTLLDVLIGTRGMTEGLIEYNGISVANFKERFGSLIGHVPQEDLLHQELTVRETLYYQAKLRLPQELGDEEIHRSIDRLCQQLDLYRPDKDVRDVRVGSPENKGLSGGQRKRLSLAIELLTDPKVLYLDEPTSGLSSRDTRLVMELLHTLASERHITVIITIHQPSLRIYRLLNKVIYLKNGRLGFFGPAYPDSISYFIPEHSPDVSGPPSVASGLVSQVSDSTSHSSDSASDVPGPDAIMEKLEEIDDVQLATDYRSSEAYRRNVVERQARMQAFLGGRPSGPLPTEDSKTASH